jgi:N-acetylglucosamine kinase-like BadF-type ATPase
MATYLGVDAGGTRTRAVIIDSSGSLLGSATSGPANWQAIGAPAAGLAVSTAITQALAAAGLSSAALSASCLGLAGVRTDDERALLAAELAPLALSGPITVTGDLEIAHAGALAARPGIVVISGTGSAAWGRDVHGTTARAGGWGWLTDDKGGGYALAVSALTAACEAEDGRGPATALHALALAFFQQPDLRALLRELHAGRRDRAAIAAFAREVRAAARSGDAVATTLETASARELLRLAEAVRTKLSPSLTVSLAITGGLGLGELLAPLASARGFTPVAPWGEPVLGAVLLAARALGTELDPAAQTRLLAAWTPTA